MAGSWTTLTFNPLASQVDVTFWTELSDQKLDVLKLSERPVQLTGHVIPNRYVEVPSHLQVDAASLKPGALSRSDVHFVPGTLLLLNTLDGFKSADKQQLLQQAAGQVWRDIFSGAAEVQPSLLCRFLLLAHADLKQFHFYYWFAFPALRPPAPFTAHAPPRTAQESLSSQALEQVSAVCAAWRRPAAPQPGATLSGSETAPSPAWPATHDEALASSPAPFWLISSPSADFSSGVTAHPLSEWAALRSAGPDAAAAGEQQQREQQLGGGEGGGSGASTSQRHVLLAFADPSNDAEHPGWLLRNALLLAAVRWQVQELQVLCVREGRTGRLDPSRSLLLQVALPRVEACLADWPAATTAPAAEAMAEAGQASQGAAAAMSAPALQPASTGWEANPQGKLLPRFLDLSQQLSPALRAEQAVDLNLRLMRWRAAPDLEVGAMAGVKCLLLGAGTLGCVVARTLQAWGVRQITLVDSSRVAFSNPVRQSLYNFEDCLQGGKPKAQAAADALQRIFPSARTRGVELLIPMPGHPPANQEAEGQMQAAAAQLDALVSEHDVVYLLTDTRESRWLPSLLAAAHGRLAITAALGFDSFVVMRHGAPPGAANAPGAGAANAAGTPRRLGCYFCNDVVAPANSTRDRSLDQQCTVARPGLAPLAGALAVELSAAVVTHPAGVCAPPPSVEQQQGASPGSALGVCAHQVRGHLSAFSQVSLEGWAFSQCTACSAAVVDAYRAHGWEFVRQAVCDPSSLEELTGLAELQRQANEMLEAADADQEGEEGGDGDGREEAEAGHGRGAAAGSGAGKDDDDWTEL